MRQLSLTGGTTLQHLNSGLPLPTGCGAAIVHHRGGVGSWHSVGRVRYSEYRPGQSAVRLRVSIDVAVYLKGHNGSRPEALF